MIHHINKLNKNHDHLNRCRKAFDKIQNPFMIKILNKGTSLVVQWVRLCAPNAGGPGLILGQGTRSRMHATTKTWSRQNKYINIKKKLSTKWVQKGTYLSIIKAMCGKPTGNIIW